MKLRACTFMSALSFLISTSVFALEGHGGGGYHSAPPRILDITIMEITIIIIVMDGMGGM